MNKLLRLFQGQKAALATVALLVFSGSLLGLALPWLIGRFVDAISQGGFAQNWWYLVVLVLVYTFDALLSFLEGRTMAQLSQRVVADLRNRLFSALTRLPASYFDRTAQGDLLSRLSNDVDNLSTSVTQSTLTILNAGIMVTGTLSLMTWLNPLLTVTAVLSISLVLLLSRTITGRAKQQSRRTQALLGEASASIEESLTGLEVIHAFGQQQATGEAFDRVNRELVRAGQQAQAWSGLMMPLMNVIGNLSFASVAALGGWLVLEGKVTVGVVATFLIYSRQFSRPINELANVWSVLQTALAGAERLFQVLDEPQEPADPVQALELTQPRGEVEFEGVDFGYRDDRLVLRHLSFKVPQGGSVALVGPTGCGKTTVVSLLMRFYELNAGRILIDGTDLREYTRQSLRRHFGVVLQDSTLFRGTIEQNLRYGRPEATDQEVRTAAHHAQADGFIRQLPLGYQTVLSENGSPLSSGQRQLLAIARALLADPKFLILDEATSNVDTRTELLLQSAVRQAMVGRTSIIIAHRLSTIRDVDRIVVMDRGQIVEQGHHEELVAKQGVYWRMLQQQRHGSDEEVADRA